eukprot:scaffold39320_cov18-Prasinocladus_malaysianus.AAC.1
MVRYSTTGRPYQVSNTSNAATRTKLAASARHGRSKTLFQNGDHRSSVSKSRRVISLVQVLLYRRFLLYEHVVPARQQGFRLL